MFTLHFTELLVLLDQFHNYFKLLNHLHFAQVMMGACYLSVNMNSVDSIKAVAQIQEFAIKASQLIMITHLVVIQKQLLLVHFDKSCRKDVETCFLL